MKICLIAAKYREGYGYQENVWAQQLAEKGHKVLVVTAGKRLEPSNRSTSNDGDYEVQRVPTWRLPRAIYLSAQAAPAIREFAPELILWFGPREFFGQRLTYGY